MTVPRVFGLPHLSEDAVAAFADGVLSPAAAVRAKRHCAECVECAEAVRGQRETAMMLRAATAPSLPYGLLDRLAGVPMSAPLPPPMSGLPTVLDADGVPMFVSHQPAPPAPDSERSQSVLRRGTLPMGFLASAAAVVAAGALGSHVSAIAASGAERQAPASINQLALSTRSVGVAQASFAGGAVIATVLNVSQPIDVLSHPQHGLGRMRARP